MLSQTLTIVNKFKPTLFNYMLKSDNINVYMYFGGENMNKILRSRKNRILSGVCGGIGEYFNIDPTVIRIVWIVLTMASFGTGFLAYLICSLVIPEDDGVIYHEDYGDNKMRENTPIFIGIGMIALGAFLLAKRIFPWFTIRLMNLGKYWPVLLILLGLYILYNQRER